MSALAEQLRHYIADTAQHNGVMPHQITDTTSYLRRNLCRSYRATPEELLLAVGRYAVYNLGPGPLRTAFLLQALGRHGPALMPMLEALHSTMEAK